MGQSAVNDLLRCVSTVGGTCPGACHTGAIAIPEVTPDVRAATTRFYQNLGGDFTPGLGLYRAATGEYLFSGDEGSRLGGALASAPYFGDRAPIWCSFDPMVNRRQVEAIEYLKEENRVLKERLGSRRPRFTDAERRRLARRAYALGRKALSELAYKLTVRRLVRHSHSRRNEGAGPATVSVGLTYIGVVLELSSLHDTAISTVETDRRTHQAG